MGALASKVDKRKRSEGDQGDQHLHKEVDSQPASQALRVCPCATPPAPLTSLALSTPPLFTSRRNTSPNSIRLKITVEAKIKLLVKFIQVKISSTAKTKAFGSKNFKILRTKCNKSC